MVALYNPVSVERSWQLGRALAILQDHRSADTPVVVGRDVGRADETVEVTTLADVDVAAIDMRTVIVIGSTTTRSFVDDHDRRWVYTPRHYPA